MRNRISFVLLALVTVLFVPGAARADTALRLLELIQVPGIAGYEAQVRQAGEMLLPISARVRADNLGNIVLPTGSPHTLIVAPFDESGLVVSAITDDGYLRVHRHTTTPGPRLQYFVGQPVVICTASGAGIAGVTATPSTHLRAFHGAADEARVKSLDDIWTDVGAETQTEAEKLAVRVLNTVTLRDRGVAIAGEKWKGLPLCTVHVPALVAQTPVETVDGIVALTRHY